MTLAEPRNYEARASFMWSATLALNTLISCGVPQDWATHMIGHEITALYGIDHAESLAVVLPRVLRCRKDKKAGKLPYHPQPGGATYRDWMNWMTPQDKTSETAAVVAAWAARG